MSNKNTATVSHIGICTADLDRSFRFYTEALGFTLKRTIDELGAPFDTLMEIPGAKLRIHQILCGDFMVELIGYIDSDTIGSADRRAMNQRGMTHMTLVVDDVEATAGRVEQYGGTVHRETQIDSPFGPLLFCTDPDGVRIELMNPVG